MFRRRREGKGKERGGEPSNPCKSRQKAIHASQKGMDTDEVFVKSTIITAI